MNQRLPLIDYGLLHKALAEYAALGYGRVSEVPWIVDRAAIDATLPTGALATPCGDRWLVGSAEQSFVQRMIDGDMPRGRWMAVSPCFRQEPVLDQLYQPHFMKLELIEYGGSDCTNGMLGQAYEVMRGLKGTASPLIVVGTDAGLDITLNGIEVGSYGYREWVDPATSTMHRWTYGTGLALPRFSVADHAPR